MAKFPNNRRILTARQIFYSSTEIVNKCYFYRPFSLKHNYNFIVEVVDRGNLHRSC